jgi:hypothetical protein
MQTRTGPSARRINRLLSAFPDESRYLEIGVFRGYTLENVRATYRWGVEPDPRFDTTSVPPGVTIDVCTSDQFFSRWDPECQFDLVFLDGLHTFRQTYRDLINALRVCRAGFVLIDSVVPSDSTSANPDQQESWLERERLQLGGNPNTWHGDVFKVIVALSKYHRSQLTFCTVLNRGKPQTIVWRKPQAEEVLPIDTVSLDSLDEIRFDEVFTPRAPKYFVPKAEEAAIRWALDAVTAGRKSFS